MFDFYFTLLANDTSYSTLAVTFRKITDELMNLAISTVAVHICVLLAPVCSV